jgi:hypothetical protein
MQKKTIIFFIAILIIGSIFLAFPDGTLVSNDSETNQLDLGDKILPFDDAVANDDGNDTKEISETDKLASGDNSNKMKYEDDWCVAAVDLEPKSLAYYKKELSDLRQEQNNLFSAGNRPDSTEGRLAPYEELDVDILKELADKNDKLALLVLLQSNSIELIDQKAKYALQMVTLGYLEQGLSELILEPLLIAESRYLETGVVDAQVKDALLTALAVVEYALKHQSATALNSYLFMLSDMDEFLLNDILSEDDLPKIKLIADEFSKLIDSRREIMQLPPMEVRTKALSKIARYSYEQKLAIIIAENKDKMVEPFGLAAIWGDSLLQKNECRERMIAFYTR